MILDPLNNLGLIVLLSSCSLIFVLACMSSTASWHKIVLSDCTVHPGQTIMSAAWNADDNTISLYLQPSQGVCWDPNALTDEVTVDCYGWDNITFWQGWVEFLVGTGVTDEEVTEATTSDMPKVYHLSIAVVFFALFAVLSLAFHYYKPETLSRFMAQFFSGFFMILVMIFSISMPASVNSSVLQNDTNWKQYYSMSSQFECNDMSSTMASGGSLAVLNIFLSIGCVIMAIFPTLFGNCYKIVDGSGSGGGGSSSSGNGLDEANTSDIKASLVSGEDPQSQYVPPSV